MRLELPHVAGDVVARLGELGYAGHNCASHPLAGTEARIGDGPMSKSVARKEEEKRHTLPSPTVRALRELPRQIDRLAAEQLREPLLSRGRDLAHARDKLRALRARIRRELA